MPTIALEGIKIFAYHGCFEEEKIIGTHFRVDLYLETDTSKAEESDNLKDTLNYQSVFEMVRDEMQQPSNLIEHVARRMLDRLFNEFPAVATARMKLYKLNPPVGGEVGSVSITLSKEREQC